MTPSKPSLKIYLGIETEPWSHRRFFARVTEKKTWSGSVRRSLRPPAAPELIGITWTVRPPDAPSHRHDHRMKQLEQNLGLADAGTSGTDHRRAGNRNRRVPLARQDPPLGISPGSGGRRSSRRPGYDLRPECPAEDLGRPSLRLGAREIR